MVGAFTLLPSCETNRTLALTIQRICEHPHWTFEGIRDAIGAGLLEERKGYELALAEKQIEIDKLREQVRLLQQAYAGVLDEHSSAETSRYPGEVR